MLSLFEELSKRLGPECSAPMKVVTLGAPSVAVMSALAERFSAIDCRVYEVQDMPLRDLRRQFAAHPGVVCREYLISSRSDSVPLHQFNQPRFNGLEPLASGQGIMPNVRSTGVRAVPALPLNAVLNESGIDLPSNAMLLVCLQGVGRQLFVQECFEDLRKFRFIICIATQGGLFDGLQEPDSLSELLHEVGFSKRAQISSTLYPFEELLFERDDVLLSKNQMALQLQTAQIRISELERQLDINHELHQEALRNIDRERQTLEVALRSSESVVRRTQAELIHHQQMNQSLLELTKELQTKIQQTEGQLTMVKSLFLESRSSGKRGH